MITDQRAFKYTKWRQKRIRKVTKKKIMLHQGLRKTFEVLHTEDTKMLSKGTKLHVHLFKMSYHEIQVQLPVPVHCHRTEKEKQCSV